MKRIIHITLTLLVISMLAPGCQKYDDGGLISKSDKRLNQFWSLENYVRNGSSTNLKMLIKNYEEEFNENGNYQRSYQDTLGHHYFDTGSWRLSEDKSKIYVASLEKLPVSSMDVQLTTEVYTVLRLKSKELKYSFVSEGNLHEFTLKRKD